MKKKKTVLVGVTGSIAAYKAAEIISQLKKKDFEVIALMTAEATRFITPLTLQTLSGNPVAVDMFAEPKNWSPIHTSLAGRADLVLIAPATAQIIAKIANGLCDDIISCTVLATKAKVIFCPAMHENMYLHQAVQENIKRLKGMGYGFLGPIKGGLACGCTGVGHLSEVTDIVKRVCAELLHA